MQSRFLPFWLAFVLLAVLTLAPLALLLKLQINNEFDVWLPPGAPQVVFDNQLRETFPRDQVLVALFEGDDLLSDRFLGALESVHRRLADQPHIERIIDVTSVDHIRATPEKDGFVVERLLDTRTAKGLTAQQRVKRVLSDRFAPGLIVSRDAHALALVIRPKHLDNSFQRLALERDLMAALTATGISGELVGLTGNIPLDVEQLRSALRDTAIFVPATTLLGLLLMWWMFRRVIAVVLALVAMSAVATGTVALLAVGDKPFTLVSALIAPLMSALTVALLVHLFNAIAHASRRGYEGRARLAAALEAVRTPARYTTLTTVAGLASLAMSEIQPVLAFGVVTAIGTVGVYAVVIGLIPPLLLHWDHRAWPRREGAGGDRIDRVVRVLARLGIRHAGWILLATTAVFVLGAPQLFRVKAETDLYQFFREDAPINVAMHKVEDELSGVTGLQVVFDGPGRDSLQDPKRLARIARFRRWVEALPEVDRATSMTDIIEQMNWAFHGEDPAYRTVPDDPRLVGQYLFVYDGTDLYDLVDHDYQRTLVALNLNVRGGIATNEVIEKIRAHLDAADLGDLRYHIAGFGRLFGSQVDLLVSGQVKSLWTALALIGLIMLVLWRSPGQAVLTMLPNIAPILLVFIIMGLFGIWLDTATALIASVTVGIAVDDTIHLFYGYKSRRRAGASLVAALARTYRHAGRAVTMTTTILCAQFLLLTTSNFVPTVEFGMLTTIGLVAALLFDVLLLPAIIVIAYRRGGGTWGALAPGSRASEELPP